MGSRNLKSIKTLLSLGKGDILIGGNSTQSFNKGVTSHRRKTGQDRFAKESQVSWVV